MLMAVGCTYRLEAADLVLIPELGANTMTHDQQAVGVVFLLDVKELGVIGTPVSRREVWLK